MPRRGVYLIHITEKIAGRAGHYIGQAEDIDARLDQHCESMWHPDRQGSERQTGKGARLLAVANYRGAYFFVSRIWLDAGRDIERKIKGRKHAERLCPECSGAIAYQRGRYTLSAKKGSR